jgi:hypothetical protein
VIEADRAPVVDRREEAEVHELYGPTPAAGAEHHVARLHVPVDDAAAVEKAECGQDLRGQIDGESKLGGGGERREPVAQQALQVVTLHDLHREERVVFIAPQVVQANDVLVAKRRDGPKFALEPQEPGGRRRDRALQRHPVPSNAIVGQPHRRHRPAAELAHEAVALAWIAVPLLRDNGRRAHTSSIVRAAITVTSQRPHPVTHPRPRERAG